MHVFLVAGRSDPRASEGDRRRGEGRSRPLPDPTHDVKCSRSILRRCRGGSPRVFPMPTVPLRPPFGLALLASVLAVVITRNAHADDSSDPTAAGEAAGSSPGASPATPVLAKAADAAPDPIH